MNSGTEPVPSAVRALLTALVPPFRLYAVFSGVFATAFVRLVGKEISPLSSDGSIVTDRNNG